MELAAKHPIVSDGPTINGEKSIVTLYTHEQLRGYPYMRQFNDLVNKAFSETPSIIAIFPEIKKYPRLVGQNALFENIGPEFFTFICTSTTSEPDLNTLQPNETDSTYESSPRHFATASCRKLWPKTVEEGLPLFLRDMSNRMIEIGRGFGEDTDLWEVKIIAVDPDLQRTGLASLLMRMIEIEATRQSAAKLPQRAELQSSTVMEAGGDSPSNGEPGPQRLVLLLDTIVEENAAFYARRGYRDIGHLTAPTGSFNATRPFRMVFMQKEISLD